MFDQVKATQAELLFVYRKRENMTQTEMAKQHNVGRVRWSLWERGLETPKIDVGLISAFLTDQERCVILRRREGITQGELAKSIGVSRWWLNQMESGCAEPKKLFAYWSERLGEKA